MKTLILDYSKWRCGSYYEDFSPSTSHGKGTTSMLNKEGYMCCLGQISQQLNPKIDVETLKTMSGPTNNKYSIPLLTKIDKDEKSHVSTKFSLKAMQINDDTETTIDYKINALTDLFKSEGYELKIINRN